MASFLKKSVAAGALVGVTTLVTSHVVSQDYENQMGEMDEAMQKVMKRWEAWEKYGQPGEQHAEMVKHAGTWHNENTFWMAPGMPPMESESIAEVTSIMGGRWVIERMSGMSEFMGEKHLMQGFGLFGYDNFQKKHLFVWVDNGSTTMMIGEGEVDSEGNIVYHSEVIDPSTGDPLTYKSIARKVSDDKQIFEMHEQQPDGSWFKHMEMVGTRK